MFLFKSDEKLKAEIKSLKEEEQALKAKVKGEQTKLKTMVSDKKQQLTTLDDMINERKALGEANDRILKTNNFLKDVSKDTKAINQYVKISLASLQTSITNNYNHASTEKVYVHIKLLIENNSPYTILATDINFNIDDLFDSCLIRNFDISSNKTIRPGTKIIASSNALIRWGQNYGQASSCFIEPYTIEDLIEEPDATSKVILKINKIQLCLLIDDKKKKIVIK